MGNGLPDGMVAVTGDNPQDGGNDPDDGGNDPDGGIGPVARGIRNVSSQGIVTVDRLLALRETKAYETTEDKAEYLAEALRESSGSDEAFQRAAAKVHVFCPDGAADEQMAGRLSSQFPEPVFACAVAPPTPFTGASETRGARTRKWRA